MNDPGRVEPGGVSQQRRDQTSRLNGFGGANAAARVCLGGFSYFELTFAGACLEFMGEASSP
jgi:hypothetical protein